VTPNVEKSNIFGSYVRRQCGHGKGLLGGKVLKKQRIVDGQEREPSGRRSSPRKVYREDLTPQRGGTVEIIT